MGVTSPAHRNRKESTVHRYLLFRVTHKKKNLIGEVVLIVFLTQITILLYMNKLILILHQITHSLVLHIIITFYFVFFFLHGNV